MPDLRKARLVYGDGGWFGRLLHARLRAFFTRSRHFSPHQRLASRALSQDGHKEHDNPQPAEKVGTAAPKQDAAWYEILVFEVGQHRRAGCAEPRLRFEQTIGDAHADRIADQIDVAAGAA